MKLQGVLEGYDYQDLEKRISEGKYFLNRRPYFRY